MSESYGWLMKCIWRSWKAGLGYQARGAYHISGRTVPTLNAPIIMFSILVLRRSCGASLVAI